MDKTPLVVVIGDSLLMDGVGASLRNRETFRIIRMDTFSADIAERLIPLSPELVIFELNAPRPCVILSLLMENPGSLFLGIDTNCSQVTVLNSSCHSIQSITEFCLLAQTRITMKHKDERGVIDLIG